VSWWSELSGAASNANDAGTKDWYTNDRQLTSRKLSEHHPNVGNTCQPINGLFVFLSINATNTRFTKATPQCVPHDMHPQR
jgi:hypothetical protein